MSYATHVVEVVRPLEKNDPKNLAWATDLCSRHRDELGAVHLGVLAAHAVMGHVVLATGGGQNLGCLVSKPKLSSDERIFPIIAAAVPDDIQRLKIGLSMLNALATAHTLDGARIVQAICRVDLPSNKFWAAAGFRPVAVRHSASVRGKPCIVWRRRVSGHVAGVEDIHTGPRDRGGGGRFVPADRPELRNWFDQTADGIESALRLSGAVPRWESWAAVRWMCPTTIDRPISDQLRLFDNPRPSPMQEGR